MVPLGVGPDPLTKPGCPMFDACFIASTMGSLLGSGQTSGWGSAAVKAGADPLMTVRLHERDTRPDSISANPITRALKARHIPAWVGATGELVCRSADPRSRVPHISKEMWESAEGAPYPSLGRSDRRERRPRYATSHPGARPIPFSEAAPSTRAQSHQSYGHRATA
jgi:hypothetical protein